MDKEIRYGGYTARPSDYDSPDGDLAASLNLINDDGALSPVHPPAAILSLQEGERVLFVHKVPGRTDPNYLLARNVTGESFDLYWIGYGESVQDTSGAQFIGSFKPSLDIAAIGNILALSLESGITYIRWRDDDYFVLGSRPPFLTIDFGMHNVGTLEDNDTVNVPSGTPPSKEDLADFTQSVYGLLLPSIADNVTKKGYFYQPFFIRYAYRLYDGSHSWHSAPILMLPSVIPPVIRCGDNKMQLNVDFFEIHHRILSQGIDKLQDWADIVVGIDIFATAPIYTYDESKNIEKKPTITLWALLNGSEHMKPDATSSEFFVGHYDYRSSGFVDHTVDTSQASNHYFVVNIKPHPDFRENVRNAHDFYRIATIDLKDIKASDAMTQLKLEERDLSDLVTRKTLDDDFQSHFGRSASSLYTFNSRLNLAGVRITPAEPFTLRSCTEFSNPGAGEVVNITVWTRVNGVRCHACRKGSGEADFFFDPENNFPRYIFYPDASAYKMEINVPTVRKYTINLTPHDHLNGAYYFNEEFGVDPTPADAEPEEANGIPYSVEVPSKVYTSEVNNPFLFPALGVNTVGNGKIFAISSAAKALSQGQFGQFPLYAFTDEGVWALETNSHGTYSARQPVTRDVILAGTKPLQMDSAVLFATGRGIMFLAGSQSQCISDGINSDTPFNPLSLPGMDSLHAMLGYGSGTCFPIVPFTEFLKGCDMIYDYAHQRVVVYNPAFTYAYMWSLRSKHWGMFLSGIEYSVNSYPEALAVNAGGQLVDFSQAATKDEAGNGIAVPALLVTRPLGLGARDIFKTVRNVIQRGYFHRGHVASVLYGSRDLFGWHLVASSKDERIGAFSGSPYKYFRIALLCNLDPGESVSGASLRFVPKYTGKLR